MGRSMWYVLRGWYRAALWRFRQIVYWPRRRLSRPPKERSPEINAAAARPEQRDIVSERPAVHRIRCAEVWGGIRNAELEAVTSGVRASLFSSSCEGGEGGDVYYFSVCGADSLTRVALADVTGHGQTVSQVGRWLYDALAGDELSAWRPRAGRVERPGRALRIRRRQHAGHCPVLSPQIATVRICMRGIHPRSFIGVTPDGGRRPTCPTRLA